MIVVTRNSANTYMLPNADYVLQNGYVYVLRFEDIAGNAQQCLGTVLLGTPAYTYLSFTEMQSPDGAMSEISLEEGEHVLTVYQAPVYSTDTSTFVDPEIRKERVKCVS